MNDENEILSTAGVLPDRVTEEASSAPAVKPSSEPAAQQPAQDPAAPIDEPIVHWHYYVNKDAVQFLLADGFVGGRLDRMKLSRLDGSAWRLTIETEVDSTCRTPAGHPFVADAVLHGSATDARRMALAMLRSHLAAVAKKHRHNAHRRARATAARKGGGYSSRPRKYWRIRRLTAAA